MMTTTKTWSETYDGSLSPDEAMHLEWQDLLKAHPDLEKKLNAIPDGAFSGKHHVKPGTKAVFFCYARPGLDKDASKKEGEDIWTTVAGDVQWYMYDVASGEIGETAVAMIDAIRSTPETTRRTEMPQATLSDIRTNIEKHIAKTYLRRVQAPVGTVPELRAWMELC
jgi:hypothetical protein